MKKEKDQRVLFQGKYDITPDDFPCIPGLANALGKAELESAAGEIILRCKRTGDWSGFTFEELKKYAPKADWHNLRLLVATDLIYEKDGTYFSPLIS